MKKTVFLSTLILGLLLAFSSQAQIEQGTVYVGVTSNLSFMSTNVDGSDDNFSQFNGQFSAGYFFMENVMIGGQLGYYSYKFGDTEGNTFSFGAFARYYIQNFFLGAGFFSDKNKDVDAVNNLTFEGGYAYFINDFISVEPSVFYSLGMGDYKDNTFGVKVGFAFYLK